MKKLIAILLILSFNTHANDVVTWNWLNTQEKTLEKWANDVGKKELVQIGQMTQRPDEIEKIRAFFPYLLPDTFFGKNMDMTCAPHFEELRKSKNKKSFEEWKKCIAELYRNEPPKWIKKALTDLNIK